MNIVLKIYLKCFLQYFVVPNTLVKNKSGTSKADSAHVKFLGDWCLKVVPRVFLLLDQLPYSRFKNPLCPNGSWRENSWMHIFPKGIGDL